MRFGSVCSGIEAASVAWNPLGWEAAWVSEIEKFPSAVLAHHYPTVPNLGDMTKLPEMILAGEVEAPDVLCGGTPCQAFSVAGLRKSLSDKRGGLTLTFVEIANAIDKVRRDAGKPPAIVFWENVPGVLNTDDGAFGCFLGALAGEDQALEPAGGKWSHAGCVFGPERAIAWRVLDAQHCGLAQRRKRVFVVACPLERAHPTQILFEFEGERRDSAPSRPEGEGTTASLTASLGKRGGAPDCGSSSELLQPVANSLSTREGRQLDPSATTMIVQPYPVANCLTQRMHKGINTTLDEGQTPVLAYRVAGDGAAYETTEVIAPLVTGTDPNSHLVATTVFVKGTNPHSADEAPTFRETETAACLNGWDERHNPPKHLVAQIGVRKLLPIECERLMGFEDDYTNIPGASDTGRYKALGNSWPVPVINWIGSRIQEATR